MKLKIFGSILSIISIFLIFSGSSVQFINTFNHDMEKTLAIENNIDQSYKKIVIEMKELHLEMTEMQEFFSLYYENVEEKKDYYQEKLETVRSKRQEIKNSLMEFEEKCKESVNEESKHKCQTVEENKGIIEDSYEKLENTYQLFLQKHESWVEKEQKIAMN